MSNRFRFLTERESDAGYRCYKHHVPDGTKNRLSTIEGLTKWTWREESNPNPSRDTEFYPSHQLAIGNS